MISWCLVLLLHCLHIKTAVCNIQKFDTKLNNVRVEFVNDLIRNQTETNNVAFITSPQDEEIIYQLQEQYIFNQKTKVKEEASISIITYDNINKDVVDTLRNYNKIDNLPVLYVAIQPGDKTINNINELTKKIKSWNYKAKVAIVFHSKVDLTIYREEKIYNIYLFTPAAGSDGGYTQYDVCQFCNKGKDAVQLSNTWRRGLGFKYKVKFDDSFHGNFHGTSLTMGTWNLKPFIYVTGTDEKGHTTRKGNAYMRYMVLAELMNMKWNFKHATDGNKYQLLSSDNKPVGIMADLVQGRVEVVGGSWIVRHNRYQYADFSSSTYFIQAFCIISIEPSTELSWFALLEAFKWYMWMLILGSLLAVAVTVYVVRRYSRYSDKISSIYECIWEPTVILLWECVRVTNPPWPIFQVYSIYMLVCLLLVSLYMGEYTSVVVNPSPISPPIDSFNQLFKQTDMKILTFSSWKKTYVKFFHRIPEIKERLEDVEVISNEASLFTILKKVQMHPKKYVFIYSPISVEVYSLYFGQPGQKKFHYSKEGLANSYTNLFFSKEFQFKETFNRKITLMQDMGLTREIVIRFAGTANKVAWDKMALMEEGFKLMTFKQFWGALALLFGGYSLSLLSFFTEVILYIVKDRLAR